MFPLSFEDLSLFFVIMALILLVTSGLVTSKNEKRTLLISKKKLKKTAIAVSILFILTVALRVIYLVLLDL